MDIRADLRGGACLLLAALCLLLPLNWLAAAGVAAVVHEGCHILAVLLLGGRIHRVTIGMGGAVLDASAMAPWKQLLAIGAGPAGSLLLVSLRRIQPIIAICGLAQGLFNLLPVYPLDGGRGLDILANLLFQESAAGKIRDSAFYGTLCVVLGAGIWGSFWAGLGTSPMILAAILVSAVVKTKISCKEGNQRVQ